MLLGKHLHTQATAMYKSGLSQTYVQNWPMRRQLCQSPGLRQPAVADLPWQLVDIHLCYQTAMYTIHV